MSGFSAETKLLCLLVLLSCVPLSDAIPDSRVSAKSLALAPALLDSTETRISPVQQEYGVGNLRSILTYPWSCNTESQAIEATVSNLMGGSQFIWIIWDMAAMSQGAEIVRVEIEHELYPQPDNQDGVRLQYRSLKSVYLPPPDCSVAYAELGASAIYTDVEMGTAAGTRRYVLGGDATLDVAEAIAKQGYFSAWIRVAAPGPLGSAAVPGWSAGGPELIVTWRIPVAVEHETWGAIKALY